MEENHFISNFKKNGYFITGPLLEKNDVNNLRKILDQEYKFKKKVVRLGLEEIESKQLQEKIVNVFSSNQIQKIAKNTEISFNKKVFMLPPFQIHKNYHVNLKEESGWHSDCGGEMQYDYCMKILKDKGYFFSKIGIYLQENGDYGGSIDVIKKSHKFFLGSPIIRKIKKMPYLLVSIIHKYFNNLYFMLPEKLFMFFLGARKLLPEVSSAVIFDSRIIHRGSPIEKNKLKDVNFVKGKYLAIVPEKNNKYSFYCHLGTIDGIDSYFFDRLKRENNANELNIWLKQVEIIKKIDQTLGEKIDQMLIPIKQKYL